MTGDTKAKSILVVAEVVDKALAPITFELLSLASRLAEQSGGQVGAIVFDNLETTRRALIAAGADHVFYQENDGSVDADVLTAAIMQTTADNAFEAILFGHNAFGSDLAPRLAFRSSGSIATNCESANLEGEYFVGKRVCYGGKARGIVRLRKIPAVITVRPGSLPPAEQDSGRAGVETPITADFSVARSQLIDRQYEDLRGLRLETAKVVIAGGRGLGGPEGFKILESVAQKLGAVVGASRVACDLGWCSPSMQIGLTGKTITPDLYIAVGISGASQHMAGCAAARTIVAINTDPDAPIFLDANIGIVGDYKELLPKIVEEIGRLNS